MVELVTVLVYGAVTVLLLLGVCILTGQRVHLGRIAFCGGLAGAYAMGCLLWRTGPLGSFPLRLVQIFALAAVAFGWRRESVRQGLLLAMLFAALEGLSMGLFAGTLSGAIVAALSLALLCFALRAGAGGKKTVTAELCFQGKTLTLSALRDTGHFLTDPLTGQDVLIAGADTAWALLGLDAQQLRDPVRTMAQAPVPRLRLIPCRTVTGTGMLLAVRCDWVRLDGRKISPLVAFSPEKLGISDEYQALTGG